MPSGCDEFEELEGGSFPGKENAIELMDSLPLLDINESIAEIVTTYISHHVMPSDPAGDALHLAIASFHKCDFLITWNCRHLANANKFGTLRNNSVGEIRLLVVESALRAIKERA